MRLTDLIRDKNEQNKPRDASVPYSTGNRDDSAGKQSGSKKGNGVSAHLNGGDLAALYDLSATSRNDKKTIGTATEKESAQKPSMFPEHAFSVPHGKKPSDTSHRETEADHRASRNQTVKVMESRTAQPVVSPEYGMHENIAEQELADALHIGILSLLDDIYEEGREGKYLGIERLIEPLLNAIELSKTSNALLRKAVRLKQDHRSFTSHSLNVALIAAKIGLARAYTDERIFSLALCALLGDIGMTRIDPAILNKANKLTAEEYTTIKRHIDYSYEIVSAVSDKFPFLAPIVCQIHERENGSGYPQGLKGANIHEFAKIIGMCDVYVALTEPKVNREHYSGYVAMQQIISRRGIDFDSRIIKSLIDVISVFPLESLVRLNNGAIGRVIDISPVHPTRPMLSILINSDGEKLKRPVLLNLEKEPLLYVENPDIEEGVVL